MTRSYFERWGKFWFAIAMVSVLTNVLGVWVFRSRDASERQVNRQLAVVERELTVYHRELQDRFTEQREAYAGAILAVLHASYRLIRAEQVANNIVPQGATNRRSPTTLVREATKLIEDWQHLGNIQQEKGEGLMIPPLSPQLTAQLERARFRIERTSPEDWRISRPTQ